MQWQVPLFDLDYNEREEAAVLEVLRSRWLTMGARTEAFESAFAEFLGTGHVVATANCTSALHMAIRAAGITAGDEVIVPDLTFVATANAVLYEGATPVLADVRSAKELTVDPADIERKVTSRTRAIVMVHYAGYPCAVDEILRIARQHGLVVIEDCAHSPGGTYGGRSLGTFGDFGCFSFFSNKNLSAGEGGAIWCPNQSTAARLRRMRSHGMTAPTLDRHRGHAWGYDVVERGYNYRLTEIEAALALVQLQKLNAGNALREQRVAQYLHELGSIKALEIPYDTFSAVPLDVATSAYHLMVVLLPEEAERSQVQASLKTRGIQTSVHYRPLHTFSAPELNSGHASGLDRIESLAPRLLTLPLWAGMPASSVSMVAEALREALSKL